MSNPTIAALNARLESEKNKTADENWNTHSGKLVPAALGWIEKDLIKIGHEAATARLLPLLEKAAEMAEYYGGDQNKKIGDKRLWEILTYDDCGKKAREFLNMIKDEVRVK